MWSLPISVLVVSVLISYPLGKYLAWIMDGRYRPPLLFKWCEDKVSSGPQNWKQYAVSLLVFNTVLYIFGYVVLVLQPWAPLNPRGLGALSPTTIFQHRYFFQYQHGHSALFRRPVVLEFQLRYSFACRCSFFRGDWILRLDCDHSSISQR